MISERRSPTALLNSPASGPTRKVRPDLFRALIPFDVRSPSRLPGRRTFGWSAADLASALTTALELHDGATREHTARTRWLAERVAPELGLEPLAVRAARYAAALHDIGKICVPSHILNKPGRLDEIEWEVMRRHPEVGAGLLSEATGFERISSAVLAHHERFDGDGYPVGLAGEEIPVEARIVSVVDAYDAMTSDRPYRQALDHRRAIEQINRNSGDQFDPAVVEAVNAVLE